MAPMNEPPKVLSLGAGVQSTAILLLSARGQLPKLDYAIFADTGWEPPAVYAHLGRVEREIAGPAGIEVRRVSSGNIRADALDPTKRFATMPLYIRNKDGGRGMMRRQCTSEYKLKPIREEVRRILGAKPRADGLPGRTKRGLYVEQWIGISTDEMDRALNAAGALEEGDVLYSRNHYPLLELGLSRDNCIAILDQAGFGETPKSACLGCPFHTNRQWRTIRTRPADWADAVAFDAAIRNGSARATANGKPLHGEAFLHASRVPLDQAPIDRVGFREWAALQTDAVSMLAAEEFAESLEDDSSLAGCSPFGCRS